MLNNRRFGLVHISQRSERSFFGYDIPLQLPLTYVNQPKAPIV
jgi:hypothetical protein